MLPEYACHISAIRYPSQKQELDLDFSTTLFWDSLIPFSSYVRSDYGSSTSQGDALLPLQLPTLPVEVLFHMLRFCPSGTLFKLMRVSPVLRAEASKIFWCRWDTYFYIEADWLLGGALAGCTDLNLEFLHYVENVEVALNSTSITDLCPRHDDEVEIQHGLIDAFWKSIARRCPRVKRVLLSHPTRRQPWWEDTQPIQLPIRSLAQACPPCIQLYILVLEEKRLTVGIDSPTQPTLRWQHGVYQPGPCSTWLKIPNMEQRKTVMVPPKKFSGPVGEYSRLCYRSSLNSLRQFALWPLIIRAIAQHYLVDKEIAEFLCPAQPCNITFTESEKWMFHIVDEHLRPWDRSFGTEYNIEECTILPSKTRALIKARTKRLKESAAIIGEEFQTLRDFWNNGGGINQKEIKDMWMEQLLNDETWETGENPENSRIWQQYLASVGAISLY